MLSKSIGDKWAARWLDAELRHAWNHDKQCPLLILWDQIARLWLKWLLSPLFAHETGDTLTNSFFFLEKKRQMVARLNSLFNKDCRHCHDHVKSLITNQEQKPTGRMSWYHPSWRQETWRRAIMKTTRMEQKTLGRIAIIKVVWHDQVNSGNCQD